MTNPVILSVIDDTLWVGDHQQRKYSKFDLNGNFLFDQAVESLNYSYRVDSVTTIESFNRVEERGDENYHIKGFSIENNEIDSIPKILWQIEKEIPYVAYGRDMRNPNKDIKRESLYSQT